MMNLYIFNQTSTGAVFGIGTYIRELTAALKESDINACVVHLLSKKPDEELMESDSIRHLYIPSPINQSILSDRGREIDLYYRNVAYLLRLHIKNTEKLVFHLNYNQCGKLAEELKKVFDCKIVTTIHYFDWCFSLMGNVRRFRKMLTSSESDQGDELISQIRESYRKEKVFFETVDHIICLSENTRQILQDDYQINPYSLTVVYNGLTDINFMPDKSLVRQKYHIPDIPIILHAGRIDEIKGLTYALQAFRIVLNRHPYCQFIIAGDGAFKIYMKECEDIWMHVTWTGLISKNKLYDLYSIADIGIMPSMHEQCSYVAIEMMMHGVPIVASTSTGLKEMIVDRETGLHIPTMEHDDRMKIDTNLLAEKIMHLLKHPEEAKRLRNNARMRFKEKYSMEVFRRNMLNFYHSLYDYTNSTN